MAHDETNDIPKGSTAEGGRKAWTPRQIKDLRKQLGMTQAELGSELYEAKPSVAQVNVSRLERGGPKGKPGAFEQASSAVRRTLRRLEENLDAQEEEG